MKTMTLYEIASACNGRIICDRDCKNDIVSDISIDSRNIHEGTLYIPIKGARFDGHDFIDSVFESGAVCTLTEKEPSCTSKPHISVKSTAQALKDIAEYYRSLFDNLTVVGISGSSGKTSTKEMIYSVLSESFNVLKTEGNLNNEIGVPRTLFRIGEEHDIAVVEMGINHFDEMTRLAKMVRPDIGVITNIGTAHLEFLGSRDGILKAKTEMLPFIKENGTAVLNGDDDKLCTVDFKNTCFFGIGNQNAYHAQNIEQCGIEGTKFDIVTPEGTVNTFVPALGNHMVMNALCAFAIGKKLGMSTEKIISGIRNFKNIDGRFNVIKTQSFTLINDCYNANPDSVKASLKVLGSLDGNKTAILADMKELGENSSKMHLDTGKTASSLVDRLICIGDDARYIAEGALSENADLQVFHFNNNNEAMEKLPDILCKNDTILIKGSHSMNLSEITEFLKNMD